MGNHSLLHFLSRHLVLGLAVAFVVLALLFWLFPDKLGLQSPEIQVVEAPPNAHLGNGPVSYAAAVKLAAPGIVNIYTTKVVQQQPYFTDPLIQRFFGNLLQPQQRLERSLGSAVIISRDGYLLSNYHVVENAEEILIAMQDGRTTDAKIIGSDPETDLAVLKVEMGELPAITLGNSEHLQVGDVALAIGNPFGVGQTVTMGIISAIGRTDLGINTFENFIQTDAAINPGNSGGGLINAYGELVGINTAIFSKSVGSEGIGFAIPINLARAVLEQIISQGYVVRGWLGLETQDLTQSLRDSFSNQQLQGVLVTRILRNGPAHHAGLLPGDVLVKIQDQQVTDSRQAMQMIAQHHPDQEIKLELLRDNRSYTTQARVMQRPVAEQ